MAPAPIHSSGRGPARLLALWCTHNATAEVDEISVKVIPLKTLNLAFPHAYEEGQSHHQLCSNVITNVLMTFSISSSVYDLVSPWPNVLPSTIASLMGFVSQLPVATT
ncbi:MAG TPA: hypothetical protein VNY29_05975 [Terriglobales bacterium]|nr:hypothetical protein [Terriglobales bacterium]